MPVINEDIHRPLTVVEPSATTSVHRQGEAAASVSSPTSAAAAASKVVKAEQQSKEFNASSSTASLNRLLTGVANSQCAITMKQSLSMTSLPPPQSPGTQLTLTGVQPRTAAVTLATTATTASHGDSGSEMIQARLRAERPYNSLKKKRGDSDRDTRELWRRSWESHSSYSLNGGAASSNGKDEFWAALQPNYNYIMDTNLIDSCREAHGEIVEHLTLQENREDSLNSCCEKTTSPESHGSNLDPRRLRRWLREMESCILKSPTLSQALRLKVSELQKLFEEHTELYRKIESQARVVGACIRSAEKEINERQKLQQQQYLQLQEGEGNDEQNLNSIESTSSSQPQKRSASSTGSVKGLEKRYHLLYLKAFEIQCMLESLLSKKEEQCPDSPSDDDSVSDTDEEPAAKHRKLSPATELSFHFGFGVELQKHGSQEIFHFYGNSAQCYDSRRTVRCHSRNSPPKRVNGSDADSEGSDCEKENKIQSVVVDQLPPPPPQTSSSVGSVALEPLKLPLGDAANQMRQPVSTDQVDGTKLPLVKPKMTVDPETEAAPHLLLEPAIGSSAVDQVSPTKSAGGMAPQQRTPQKRLRPVDSSKFNRSARKSKNCATFYFKHLDTDGENQIGGGFSSQNDEGEDEFSNEDLLLSNGGGRGVGSAEEEDVVATSQEDDEDDDDEWLYTNNKFNSTAVNGATDTAGDSPEKCIVPQISISEDSVFERDPESVAAAEKSFYSNGNGKASHSSLVQLQCSKESIHQLVLNAENLVREEVFLQQKIQQQQQQLPLSRRHHSHPQQHQQQTYYRQFSSPVLTTPPTSAKCNGGSNYHRSDAAGVAIHTMKVTNSAPAKKLSGINGGGGGVSSGARKCDQLKIKLVQEWLEQQPLEKSEPQAMFSNPATDCEASGEYTTESDCAQPDSDSSSEGVTDSVATCCMQSGVGVASGAGGASSSVEIIGGSADLLSVPAAGGGADEGTAHQLSARDEVVDGLTPIQHSKVVMRNKRRNSERPWSVSSLSQLQKAVNRSSVTIGGSEEGGSSNQLFANFSISESALHTLSPGRTSTSKAHIKPAESRSSLKRRKYRMKRRSFGKRSDSGSEGGYCGHRESTKTLSKSESFSGNVNGASTVTLSVGRRDSVTNSNGSVHKLNSRRSINMNNASSERDSGEEAAAVVLVKPAFKLGSATHVYGATNLGPLAQLSTYNGESGEEQKKKAVPVQKERALTSHETVPEDHSYEQAWDDYQEKYNSENYSEGLDTEAAKRLLEFGDDDYRRHIDSQSDCCSSSLSAANNVDSLSPPRHRKFGFDNGALTAVGQAQPQHQLSLQSSPQILPPGHCDSNASNNSNTLRRRRALEFAEYERRRKNSESSRKRFDDRRRSTESSHSYKFSPKHGSSDGSGRKKSSSVLHLVKPRETSSSTDALSSENDSTHEEDDLQIQSLLMQSRGNLERTEALRVRSHLLRAEDYAEILATCQENINGMNAMLRGPTVTVLSPRRCQEMRELLSSWESLAKWSENAAEAKCLQEEMHLLKVVIKSYGTHCTLLESKEAIDVTIQAFQEEKVKLKSHRQTMLKLNSRVHSWVTRQENEFNLQQQQQQQDSQLAPTTTSTGLVDKNDGQSAVVELAVGDQLHGGGGAVDSGSSVSVGIVMDKCSLDRELQVRLKDDVSDLYNSWDEAEARINGQLIVLTSALQTWTQLEVGLGEFTHGLDKYRTLYELKDVLDRGEVQLPADTVMDVRQVSRLLTERIEAYQQTRPQDATLLHPSSAILYSLKSYSNGSLSDSGISDGGCGSDGGLSERERRLGSLRRLAKQLESNLAPGSVALETIYQRLQAAEEELKRLQELQETCREAVERLVRTSSPTGSAASTASVPLGQVEEEELLLDAEVGEEEEAAVTVVVTQDQDLDQTKTDMELIKNQQQQQTTKGGNNKAKKSSPASKRKNKKRTSSGGNQDSSPQQKQVNVVCEPETREEAEKRSTVQVVDDVQAAKEEKREVRVPIKETTWSGEKIEDPDTDDIDLLLMNNYRNYQAKKNGGNYLLEDGIEEFDGLQDESLRLTQDTDGDDEYEEEDDDIEGVSNLDSDEEVDHLAAAKKKRGWGWRVARIAVPLQFALISLFCVARLFEPQCCDVVNNFSMSFTPHLRYVRGPPPM